MKRCRKCQIEKPNEESCRDRRRRIPGDGSLMNYWEQDDIDCTSWELAMKTALKRYSVSGRKQYVWAFHSKRGGIGYVATEWKQTEAFG